MPVSAEQRYKHNSEHTNKIDKQPDNETSNNVDGHPQDTPPNKLENDIRDIINLAGYILESDTITIFVGIFPETSHKYINQKSDNVGYAK
jgi:hypothetical protein